MTSCIILTLPGYARESTTPRLTQNTDKLDNLKESLSLATDSLEVAGLCYEIYRHMVYDLLVRSSKEVNYLIRALRIYEMNKMWSDAALINIALGGIYLNRKQFDLSRKYWNMAKELYRKSHDLRGEVVALSNISETYSYESTIESQNLLKTYLDSTIVLARRLNDPTVLIWPYLNLAKWYIKKQDSQSAEEYTELAIAIAKNQNDIRSTQSGIYQLGMIRKWQGETEQAIQLIEQSLSYNALPKTSPDHLDALFEVSELHRTLGNFKMAYNYLSFYKVNKDTLILEQHAKAMLDLEIAYETEKKEQELKEKNSDIALLAAKDKVKSQWIVFGTIGLVALFIVVSLIRSRNYLKKQKRFQENFSRDLITAQEQERTRIAKELHDSVGQQLTLIKKKAQNEHHEEFTSLTNTALEEVRSISRALYPASLKQLGLSESIEQLLYDLDEEVDMFFSVDIEDINNSFDENKTLNFYRFIQESVNNVIKHAKAKTLKVGVTKREGMIEVLIEDNGCGFNNASILQSESLGLKTMAERIRILRGTLSIYSKVGQGTRVAAKIPVSA